MTWAEIAVFKQARFLGDNNEESAKTLIAKATLKVLKIECDHKTPNGTAINHSGECEICGENR